MANNWRWLGRAHERRAGPPQASSRPLGGQRSTRSGKRGGCVVTGLDERDDYDGGQEQTAPVWAVFGDLMAGLLGAFVLVLVGVLVVQMDLVANLNAEIEKR